MKVAVFHSFLDNIGGAEIVALFLARAFKADIYTTNIDLAKINKMGFSDVVIKSIGQVPIRSPFRQQLTLEKFKNLNLSDDYDFFIIAGDWAVSAAVNNKPNLWYVHSMMKEIWDLAAITKRNNVNWFLRPAFDVWVKINRKLILKFVESVDSLVVNSRVTQKRVSGFLGREALVIYPPVDVAKYRYNQNGDFWLSVNRLINHKKVELQLETFRRLPDKKLVIVGSYEQASHFTKYVKYLKKNTPDNVEILSWVNQGDLINLYANCRGFIATSDNEDFGLTVVEAMAAGKPVIAPNLGGYRESVIDGKCGILIDEVNPDSLIKAVNTVEDNIDNYKDNCLSRSRQFGLDIFVSNIKKEIQQVYENSLS